MYFSPYNLIHVSHLLMCFAATPLLTYRLVLRTLYVSEITQYLLFCVCFDIQKEIGISEIYSYCCMYHSFLSLTGIL